MENYNSSQSQQGVNSMNMGQPYPGQFQMSQPIMQSQAMQSQTMQSQAMQSQAMQPQTMQPMMQAQIAQRPPKQPMDPAKKKKLIIGLSVSGIVLVLGIIVAIVVPILLRVDYAYAYNTAKELKPKIYDIYQSQECRYVVRDVDYKSVSIKSYNGYIENCKKVYSPSVAELVDKLGDTDGVKRNDGIRAKFERFKSEYSAIAANDSESLDAKFAVWQASHSFVVASSNLNYGRTTDAEFKAAANYLIDSGNEILRQFGETWLTKSLETAAAYRAYQDSPWRESSQRYDEYSSKRKELGDWIAANAPNVAQIAPLDFDNTAKVYNEFNALYDSIAKTYTENYNYGSGDCTEAAGEVYCN